MFETYMQKLDREHQNIFFIQERKGGVCYAFVYDSEKYVFHAHHIVAILPWYRTHYGYPQDNQQSVFKLPIATM